MTRSLPYLPDIDGLRAFAVLAVVLFHLQIPGFAGGYVGVDIFFVISGFLISGLIRDRVARHQFRFVDFYASRVTRLLPAVLATVAASSIASVALLQPLALEAFARSAAAAVFSLANIAFYMESGYWDASSDLKPLLHMWSLGVEEQFYLFWPALLVLLSRARSQGYVIGLIALGGASFAASVMFVKEDSAAVFYLLPFRVWQFCLGALIVEAWRHADFSLFTQQLLRAAGLALCSLAVINLDEHSYASAWPALLPSIGAALVLLAANKEEPSPWLANPLALWLGRISYSLYLAHWPPIALWRSWSLAELDLGISLALGLVTFVLGAGLHYGVEARFYQRGQAKSEGWQRRHWFSLTTGAVLAAGLVAVSANPGAFAVRDVVLDETAIKAYMKDRLQLTGQGCRIDLLDRPNRCNQTLNNPILILGNSHEPDGYNILASALPENYRQNMVSFGSTNGCKNLRIEGDWVVTDGAFCQKRLDALRASLDTVEWATVVYSAHMPFSANKAPEAHMLTTLKAHQPNSEIIVLGGYIGGKHRCAQLINKHGSPLACREPENVAYFAGNPQAPRQTRERFESLMSAYVDKVALLCPNGGLSNCRIATPDGHPAFVDEHHLTFEFASYLGGILAAESPDWLSAIKDR